MHHETMDAEAIPGIPQQPADAIHSGAGHADIIGWLACVRCGGSHLAKGRHQAAHTVFRRDIEYRCPGDGIHAPVQIEEKTVSEKKAYPLRINAEILEAVQRWSDDELRSLNAQIEYVLRDALRKNGRLKTDEKQDPEE